MAETGVLREVLCVVSGAHELIGLPQAVPLLAGKIEVAAASYIIVGCDDVERRRIGGGVAIGIILEPVYETSALGNFVGNLSVLALELGNEFDCGAGGGEVANRVEGERSPHGIAPKEPGEAGTLAGSRRPVSCDQTSAQRRIRDQSLNGTDARPVIGLLKLRIGQSQVDGASEVVAVIPRGLPHQIRTGSRQALVGGLRFSYSLNRSGNDN